MVPSLASLATMNRSDDQCPAPLPRSLDEIKQLVKDKMDVAMRQAHYEGLQNIAGKNLLGNRAYRYTEYFLDQINLQLAKSRIEAA